MKGPLPLPTSIASGTSMSNPFLMPSHISPFLHGGAQQCTVTLPALYHQSGSSAYFSMDTFDPLPPALDSLDSLSITGRALVNWLARSGVIWVLFIQMINWLLAYLSPLSWYYRLCSEFVHGKGNFFTESLGIHPRLCFRLILYLMSYC